MKTANKLSSNFQEIYPEVVEKKLTASEANFILSIPEELSFFDGHFDESHLVPGYIMIAWAISYAKEVFDINPEAYKISNAKFTQKITPGMRINLNLTLNEQRTACNFNFSEAGTLKSCAKGTVEINPDFNQSAGDE